MKRSIQNSISGIRTEYTSEGLDEKDISDDPLILFDEWMKEAEKRIPVTPNATFLATVGNDGKPSGRIVLLRGYDERGFVFYTNCDSRKGTELRENNNSSMTFFWNELFRQIRVEGKVFILPEEESDLYFSDRPRESQLAALASEQSRRLESRELLEERLRELEKRYEGKTIPRPLNWGGYYLSPMSVEFWQGREFRLHDRLLYHRNDLKGEWKLERLYP